MKRVVPIVAVFALALALAGCSSSAPSASSSASLSAASDVAASLHASDSGKWTAADSADAAAKGASISKFAVPDSIVIVDVRFEDPAFAYAEHIAEAAYVEDVLTLVVRKAEGAHSEPLTARDKSEFAESWTSTYEGYDVTCYGNTKGQATIALWNDGTKEYGVTLTDTADTSVAMDSEDVDDIVKAVKNAESGQSASSASGAAVASGAAAGGQAGFNVEKVVQNNKLGELVSYYYVQGVDGKYYWAIVTTDEDGNEYTSYADASGNVVQGGVETTAEAPNNYDSIIESANVAADQYNLGEIVTTYYVMGNDGTYYQAIVARGADGAQYTTYLDASGSVVQGGDINASSIPEVAQQ